MGKGNGSSAYERVFLGIAVTVTAVWSLATIVQVISPAHPVPETANLTMGTVAAAFFGGALISSRRRNVEAILEEEEEDTEDPPSRRQKR